MDRHYPNLKRPQRKLCYATNNESSNKQWAGKLSLQDVDKIFDDLDSMSDGEELQLLDNTPREEERETSLPPQQNTEKHPQHQLDKCPKRKLPPACPELEIVMDTPLKVHRPLKTSSPIEETMDLEEATVSPIMFDSDDDGKEAELKQCDQKPIKLIRDCLSDSPPNTLSLRKVKTSNHNSSSKAAPPVAAKLPQIPRPAALGPKTNPAKEENTEAAERQQPEHMLPPAGESQRVHRQPESETSSHVAKCVPSFLQALREARKPKTACSRNFLSPHKAATLPPEPDDDFLIMEEALPVWLSIPRNSTTSNKQNKDSSTNKKSSPDKKVPKTKRSSKVSHTLNQAQTQKTKKKKGKGDDASAPETSEVQKETERMKVDGLGADEDGDILLNQDDPPAGDIMEAEKTTKQKKLQRVPTEDSKAVDKLKDRPVGGSSSIGDSDREQLTGNKSLKSSQANKFKPVECDEGNKNAHKSQPLKARGGRKKKEIPQEQSDEDYRGTEDPCSPQQEAEDHSHSAKDDVTPKTQRLKASNRIEQQEEALGHDKGSSSEDSQLLVKRKRKQTGQWWLSSSSQPAEEPEATPPQPVIKKSRAGPTKPRPAGSSPAKAVNVRVKKKHELSTPSSSPPLPSQKVKKTKQKKNKHKHSVDATVKAPVKEHSQNQDLDPTLPDQGLESALCSPLAFPHGDVDSVISDQVFPKLDNQVHDGTPSRSAHPHKGTEEQPNPSETKTRRRRPPSAWWQVEDNSKRPTVTSLQSQSQPQPQQLDPKRSQLDKGGRKPSKSSALGHPKDGNVAILPKRPESLPKSKLLSAPRPVKRSLAKFNEIFTLESPFNPSRPGTSQNNKRNVATSPAEVEATLNVSLTETGKEQNHQSPQETPQDSKCSLESRSTFFQSGQVIDLEQHEENEDVGLPSSRVVPTPAVLSMSELCGPPLRPFVLEEKDKANLTQWLKSFWSAAGEGSVNVTSDHYDWYFYQGRAIGFQEDLQASSFCSGKILLGSYMKKPLWVDHSATTGFLVLTSSVTVTINGSESQYNPGQAFMVQCGHAYSIQNRTVQPAVLSFHRMLAESSD